MWKVVIDEKGTRAERDPFGEMTEEESRAAVIADLEGELGRTRAWARGETAKGREAERQVEMVKKRLERARGKS